MYIATILIEREMSRALVGEGELMSSITKVKTPSAGKGIWSRRHPLCHHNQGCLQYSFQVTSYILLFIFFYSFRNIATLDFSRRNFSFKITF